MARLTAPRAAQGYEVLTLRGDAVYRLRDRLEAALGILAHYAPTDLTEQQVAASKRLHAMPEWREILTDNVEALAAVVGDDLLHQREPYLRVARPNRPEDQVGIHRDTHYGASADEWVLWVPLTNATHGAEMRIMPGSHLLPEEALPWTQFHSPDCPRGSDKHWLGFRYAPKRMSLDVEAATLPVSCRLGEAILFNSACVHGQIVNGAPWTRVSIDIRLVDARATIQRARGLHGDLYKPLRIAESA